jgi:4-hydroxy-4-methyl-2-oxoglutarate aldolase
MTFPVWSKCISAQGTVKKRLGSVNVPVTCAGAAVEPGDVVVGDDDGVVIVARAHAADVLAEAKAREEKETRSRECYQRGELFLDMNNVRGELERLGLRYVDHEDTQ